MGGECRSVAWRHGRSASSFRRRVPPPPRRSGDSPRPTPPGDVPALHRRIFLFLASAASTGAFSSSSRPQRLPSAKQCERLRRVPRLRPLTMAAMCAAAAVGKSLPQSARIDAAADEAGVHSFCIPHHFPTDTDGHRALVAWDGSLPLVPPMVAPALVVFAVVTSANAPCGLCRAAVRGGVCPLHGSKCSHKGGQNVRLSAPFVSFRQIL